MKHNKRQKNLSNAIEGGEVMKKGDIVQFVKVIDRGDQTARMILLDNPSKGRVTVEHIVNMAIRPTSVYRAEEAMKCVY
jgi:hypothetical protein